MDVWIFSAAREGCTPVVIEVFAFEPSKTDKRRAVRDHLDRKIPWHDYKANETVLRQEDLERALYRWPESLYKVQRRSVKYKPN